MGSILERPRRNGTIAYLAKIAIMREGKVVYRESRTFDRRPAAATWIEKRETELTKPGGIAAALSAKPTLAMAIERYIVTSRKKIGKTKAQVLETLKGMDIAQMACSEINSQHIIELAETLSEGRKPQTVGNYLSHLQSVFAVAKPAWGFELDAVAMAGAAKVNKRLGLTSKSKKRERRPSLKELDKLMTHFGEIEARRVGTAPMQKIVLFAIFSTRRQEEITRIKWDDLEPGRVLVRDMKHPGDKTGNDTWCDLVPEAEQVIKAMIRAAPEIFPVSSDAVSAAFTRACYATGINTEDMPDELRLHFHDLRHDGVSRLFEMGWNIPHVAAVSGHRSWQSLKRYTHLRQTGDKYANWKWLEISIVRGLNQ
jgi:integrase